MKKKSMAVWLVVAMIFMLLGAVLVVTGCIMGGTKEFTSRYINVRFDSELVEGESDEYAGVTAIKVNAKNIAIKILPSENDKFKVEYAVNSENEVPFVAFNNGVLDITQEDERFFLINFDFGSLFNVNQRVVTVYVPKNAELSEVKIDTSNGSITLDNEFSMEKLNIETNNGAIKVKDVVCKESLDIKTSNGSVKCDGTFYKESQIKTSNGRVELDGQYYGDIEVKTSNGSIDAHVDGEEKDYDLDLDTSNGSIRVDGDKKDDDYEKDNDAKNELKLKTSNGSIEVEFE